MRRIVISVMNGLLCEAISNTMFRTGEFLSYKSLFNKTSNVIDDCGSFGADICLMEVSYAAETTLDTRLKESLQIKRKFPECKVIFLCDENSAPDIARGVAQAKKDGIIDTFFYSSVTEKYLAAALTSM